MSHYDNYVQWAKDAEINDEPHRALEFWKMASKLALLSWDSELCEGNIERLSAADFSAVISGKTRTGRRTLRGEHAKGIIILEFTPPNLINLRMKGRRKRFPTTLQAVYDFAARCEARRIQDERTLARKARAKLRKEGKK